MRLASTLVGDSPRPPSQLEADAPEHEKYLLCPPWAQVPGEHDSRAAASSAALPRPCPGCPCQATESPAYLARSPSTCPTHLHAISSVGCSRKGPSDLGQAKVWVWTTPRLQCWRSSPPQHPQETFVEVSHAGAPDPGLLETHRDCALSRRFCIWRIETHGWSPCPGRGTCRGRQGAERVLDVPPRANLGLARLLVELQGCHTYSGKTRRVVLGPSGTWVGTQGRPRAQAALHDALDRPAVEDYPRDDHVAEDYPRQRACPTFG